MQKDRHPEVDYQDISLVERRQAVQTGSRPNAPLVGTSLQVGGTGRITRMYTLSTTVDFPNTNANTFSDVTKTITGAQVGDLCVLGIDWTAITGGANGFLAAFVSGTDTVTIRFHNLSGSPINPGSQAVKLMVIQFV